MDAMPSVPAPVTPPVSNNQEGFGNAAAKAADAKPTTLKDAATAPAAAEPKATADSLKATTPAEKEVIRKLKVGDTEYDETTLQQMIEKSKGADKKFLEAAKKSKEAMRFFKMAKENPKEFLIKTGMDPKKFAYDEVAEDLKNKLRDPKEIELESAQKRLKEYETKEAEAKKQKDAELLEKRSKAFEQKLHAEMIDALETFPELPKNGFTVSMIARAIDTVREKHGVLLSAKEVAPKVVNDIRQMVTGIVKGSSPEQLIALIGEEGMAAIRKYDIARLKNPLSNGQGSSNADGEDKPKAKKYKSSHDFWKDI